MCKSDYILWEWVFDIFRFLKMDAGNFLSNVLRSGKSASLEQKESSKSTIHDLLSTITTLKAPVVTLYSRIKGNDGMREEWKHHLHALRASELIVDC